MRITVLAPYSNVIRTIVVILICTASCHQVSDVASISDQSSLQNRVNPRDSALILSTVKEYSKLNWYTFTDYSRMYSISNDDITYFIESAFYSPDSNRIVVWLGEKMFNALTISKYSSDEKNNRICPLSKDTVYNFSVLIGYRNNRADLWKLYPWGNRQVPCCSSKSEGLAELENYYFNMRNDVFTTITVNQQGKKLLTNIAFKYSLLDKAFWDKSILWQKDTICLKGLYPFEEIIKSLTDTCVSCVDTFKLPTINYADSILKNYNNR